MQIEVLIKDLLYTHDCVIVPNMGGFVSNYKSAGVKNTPYAHFQAPSKFIVFNENLKIDDGLLTNSLSTEYGLTFAEAKKEIDLFVNRTNSELNKGNKIKFEGLGIFVKNSNNNIVFEPNISENLLADSFGLGEFEFPVLKNPEIIKKEARSFRDIDPERRMVIRKYVKRALIAAPVVASLFLIPANINKIQLSDISNIFHSTERNIVLTDIEPIVKEETSNPIEKQLEESVQKNVALKYVESEPVKSVKTYYIISGSFKSIENAEKQIATLKANKIDAFTIEGDGYFRVYLDKFENKENAENRLNALKQSNQLYNSYWIYSK